jgi:hypothetical protein
MRRVAIAALLALALSACSTPRPHLDTRSDALLNIDAGRLIVVTVDNSRQPLLSEPGSTPRGYSAATNYAVGDQARAIGVALAHDYSLQAVREWPIAQLRVNCVVFAVAAGVDRDGVLQRLVHDPRVRGAQPLQLFNALSDGSLGSPVSDPVERHALSVAAPSLYNDPYFALQHGFAEMGAAEAQQWSRGEGVRVAIIDTGVATSHPDLEGRVRLSRNFIDDDQQAFETDRHGTEVAGIIGADANNGVGIVGIAPAVQLMVFKACEPSSPSGMDAVCNSFTLARALGAALDAHAQIVNLSLGGPADPLLAQLVSYGVQHGVLFVGAVPESGRLDGFPVSISGVIAVDLTGRNAGVPGVLHAPGRDIVSTAPGGRYDFVNGSSFAAAHVTGALALLHAHAPELRSERLSSILSRTASTSQDGGDAINVCAAMDVLQSEGACMNATRSVATVAPAR